MGNVTISTVTKQAYVIGNVRMVIGSFTMSNSYATGGDSVNNKLIPLKRILKIFLSPKSGYIPEYDLANNKVKVYGQEPTSTAAGVVGLSEVAAATDLSTVSFDFIAIGV